MSKKKAAKKSSESKVVEFKPRGQTDAAEAAVQAFLEELTDLAFRDVEPDDEEVELTPLDEAQDLVYEALDCDDPKKAIRMAKKALSISADCADAYALLAQLTADTLEEAVELYSQAVEAAERALGPKVMEQFAGNFWLAVETRPYMRSRAAFARVLWEFGDRAEAVEHYREMIRLNEFDSQGIRFPLMSALLELGRDEEAEELFEVFEESDSAEWAYARALLDFREHGRSAKSAKSLKAALKKNKHIPAYLLGRESMPDVLPDYVGFGDESEAISYAFGNDQVWATTQGALRWLAEAVPRKGKKTGR